MSNEKQETIDDIVREMCNLGKLDEKLTDKIPRSLMGLGLRTFADRLEAAAKSEELRWAKANGELARMIDLEKVQVGNAAAMRAAVERCVDLILRFGNAELVETPLDVIIDIETILKAALRSAPPKNCDRYETTDKAMNTLREMMGGAK